MGVRARETAADDAEKSFKKSLTYRVRMSLVRFEFFVVRVLYVDRPASELRHRAGEVIDHGGGRGFLAHLQEGLVLPFEDQHVGHPAEGYAQVDDLRFGDVVWNVADVDDARRFADVLLVELHLRKQRNVLY